MSDLTGLWIGMGLAVCGSTVAMSIHTLAKVWLLHVYTWRELNHLRPPPGHRG